MTPFETWSLIISGLGVVASTAVAVLAIWGGFFSSRLAGPVLRVSLVSPDGERTTWTSSAPTPTFRRALHPADDGPELRS